MSEENGELVKTSSPEFQLPSEPSPDDATTLSQIEARLAKADSAQDAILWTQVRGEIIQQDKTRKDGEHRRFLEKTQVLYDIGLSISALAIGTILVAKGFAYAGLLILGAGLKFAPDYLKEAFLRRGKGEGNEDN